jgi:hypothetical protein
MDRQRSQAFMLKLVGDVGTAMAAALAYVGDEAGLFRAMAGAGPLSAAGLAERAGVHPRYVEEWLADRVSFVVAPAEAMPRAPSADGRWDLITTFDVFHDLPDPDRALRAIRGALYDGGTYLMVEPKVEDTLAGNVANPFSRMLYGISCLHCVPQSLAQGGPGLGACWGPARAAARARDAGFGHFQALPIRSPALAFYEARAKG